MPFTNYWANSLFTYLIANFNTYVALHSSNPTNTGLSTTEIVGGSYIRQLTTWTIPTIRTIINNSAITFNNLPACTVSYLALWDASTGGNCLYSLAITPIVVTAGGTLVIPTSDLAIVLS